MDGSLSLGLLFLCFLRFFCWSRWLDLSLGLILLLLSFVIFLSSLFLSPFGLCLPFLLLPDPLFHSLQLIKTILNLSNNLIPLLLLILQLIRQVMVLPVSLPHALLVLISNRDDLFDRDCLGVGWAFLVDRDKVGDLVLEGHWLVLVLGHDLGGVEADLVETGDCLWGDLFLVLFLVGLLLERVALLDLGLLVGGYVLGISLLHLFKLVLSCYYILFISNWIPMI